MIFSSTVSVADFEQVNASHQSSITNSAEHYLIWLIHHLSMATLLLPYKQLPVQNN